MKLNKKFIGILSSAVLIIILLIPLFNVKSTHPEADNNKIKIHYIDVGQGDSILVQVNNINLLIDAGPYENTSKLISYLNKQHIKKLHYIIATHPHDDHIGAMSEVIKKFNIGEFYAPKKAESTTAFQNMVLELKNKNKKINIAKAGVSIDLGNKANCEILAPNNSEYKETNNYSAVIKITYGNSKFIFTGDAEKLSEKEMLEKNYDLSSEVLKVGHHGSTTSSSTEFLDKVNPEIAIISCGKGNMYGHPNKGTILNLKYRNIQIYRTDIDGNIVIVSNGNSIEKQ
ncbi:ComEC/Rec2 family competence protein [Clostridium sp. JN-9]|uniref:ComEC/Rec2 family competence protein n=1 Tax=Clostridium sp. JN-9 TaxID=2507159 RepID=UPI000FFE132D|nr:ComEC/Rec2 family competence protein [Clostridium sp. JN-9]QAT41145.1 MBL fold metallo-hydrolase [Clostridium sp. JN-9]